MATWSRAVIVGASSGIGRELARQLAAAGTEVVLVARNREALDELAHQIDRKASRTVASVYVCDVRDVEAGRKAFGEIVAAGPFDLIVYSSGIMPRDSAKGYPTEEDVRAIETNFTGAVVWLNEAAQLFLRQGHGTIVGIGSVAGDRGRRGNPVYNATKAALATYLEALRFRLTRRGITVVTIKPGFIRTPMLGSRRPLLPAAGVEITARQIITAAREGRRVAYVPPWWQVVAIVLKAMPPAIMERLPV